LTDRERQRQGRGKTNQNVRPAIKKRTRQIAFPDATREAVPTDVNDVFNYVAAMDHGLARLKTLPLSLRLIREIHAKLLLDVRGARDAGEFREKQNWIGPAGSLLADAVYVPQRP
jgi:Fic family protein